MTVTVATPAGYELVRPDPNANLNGIKWEVEDDFTEGEFSLTLDAQWNEGVFLVAAKGPGVALSTIAGPECTMMDSDFDKDGYTLEQGDCNDKNPEVYPGAEEICGDGIDQDCSGNDMPCMGPPGETITCEDLFIPPGHLPPAGECKVWSPGLAPGRQGPPVPCDCSLAPPGDMPDRQQWKSFEL